MTALLWLSIAMLTAALAAALLAIALAPMSLIVSEEETDEC